jgi:uncharacterized protein (DUF305 family)
MLPGAAFVLVGALASACTPDDGSATSAPSSVVVQPGRPGEPARTVAPEDYADGVGELRWNQADVDFMTHMIGHHLQALEISELAADRAEAEQVRAIASRIYDTQGAEIHALAAWLQERGQPVPAEVARLEGSGPRGPGGDHATHGHHADMPGMLTPEQVAALEAASGAEFDRLFLEGMIQHHEGAVDMSVEVLTHGSDARAEELATDIGAGQTAEIGRLQDILDSL